MDKQEREFRLRGSGKPSRGRRLIAELGDPARFRSAAAIASYVGVAPRLRQSGKKRFSSGSPTIPLGNARPRKALWTVVLNAVRCNPCAAYRWQYIHSGAQHPRFAKVLSGLITESQGGRIEAALATL